MLESRHWDARYGWDLLAGHGPQFDDYIAITTPSAWAAVENRLPHAPRHREFHRGMDERYLDELLPNLPDARQVLAIGGGNALRSTATAKTTRPGKDQREVLCTYDYCDESGELLYQAVRFEPKGFSQRRPDGKGGWIWNLDGVPKVLYRLPEILAADISTRIFVVEGEKDADAIAALGGVATTNPLGAGKRNVEHSRSLTGRTVVIVPDNDESGHEHALQVAQSLSEFAASVKVLAIPELPKKGDVSDYFGADGTFESLLEITESTPRWQLVGEDRVEANLVAADHLDRGESSRQSDHLVEIAKRDELFHDDLGTTFAAVSMDGHREIWPVGFQRYRQFLSRIFYKEARKVPNGSALTDAIGVVSGIARFDGGQHRLSNRVVMYEGAIWYDLADPRWRAVRISADGWEIVDHPPILFQRFTHQLPQVEPVRGGTVELLQRHLPLQDSDRLLLTVYLVTAFIPEIPHPMLHPHGKKGSGKTVLSRICRRLVDPSQLEVASFPRKRDELVQQLSHNYMPVFDNVDNLSVEQSDLLCRAVTDEGFSKRALYTDDEDVIYRYRRCPVLNGINIAAQRPDLLDRAIVLELEPITPGQRKTEEELFAAFEQDRGLILGAIFVGLSKAMRQLSEVALESYSRMADFERWGVSIARALGIRDDDFLQSYSTNRLNLTEEAIAAHPTGQCVVEFMKDRLEWTGKPADLYEQVRTIAARLGVDRADRFPKAANALSRRLREVNGNLREVGIAVRLSKSGPRRIDISKDAQNTVQPSADPVSDD